MGVVVSTNIASLIAQQNLTTSNKALRTNVERLSSGFRVNSSKDDAAGLARADQLRAQSRGIQAALRNANDAISALEVVDKSSEKITEILTRMNELAVSAAQGTLTTQTRGFYSGEWNALRDEIQRISDVTEFGGKKLMQSFGSPISVHIGYKNTAADSLSVSMFTVTPATLATLADQIATLTGAQSAISVIATAIGTMNTVRASFGAASNRLESTVANLQVTYTNFQAAESRIRDVDFAVETASFTKNQILVQSGIAVLAQSNTLPQAALSLLA